MKSLREPTAEELLKIRADPYFYVKKYSTICGAVKGYDWILFRFKPMVDTQDGETVWVIEEEK